MVINSPDAFVSQQTARYACMVPRQIAWNKGELRLVLVVT
jgi:hypothetical protein